MDPTVSVIWPDGHERGSRAPRRKDSLLKLILASLNSATKSFHCESTVQQWFHELAGVEKKEVSPRSHSVQVSHMEGLAGGHVF